MLTEAGVPDAVLVVIRRHTGHAGIVKAACGIVQNLCLNGSSWPAIGNGWSCRGKHVADGFTLGVQCG